MKLCQALNIQHGQVVAFVGAGGKTTAAWQAQAELAASGERAVVTTTTKMMEPVLPSDGALMLAGRPDAARIAKLFERASRLVLASRRLSEPQSVNADHPVPSRPFKLDGLPPDILSELAARLPGVTWLIEADGAKGAGLKIPAAHEPVIPACATLIVVMAHLDVLGQPLTEKNVHRVNDAMRLFDVPIGAPITAAMFARVLTDEALGLKDTPPRARAVAMLTQKDATLDPEARVLADQLLRSRYERVVAAALRAEPADERVLMVMMR